MLQRKKIIFVLQNIFIVPAYNMATVQNLFGITYNRCAQVFTEDFKMW